MLLLKRNGYPEETYHTFSYSPLRGDGGLTEGLMCVVTEETERVISERRLNTLRALADGLIGTQTIDQVLGEVRGALAFNGKDFPFGLIYLRDHAGRWRGEALSAGASPLLDIDWPLQRFEGSASARRIPLNLLSLNAPQGPWQIPPIEALLLPIARGAGEAFGTLVLGLNPYRPRDPEIVGFSQLIAGQISGALSNAEALDSERRRADRIWVNSRDLLVVVDAAGIFRSVSPSWTRVLGYAPEELIGSTSGASCIPTISCCRRPLSPPRCSRTI